jgi:hypothetical protein
MLQGITINDLVSRIMADARTKQDFIVPSNAVKLMDGERLSWGDSRTSVPPMPMTNHAMGQLNTYLGIPSRFVDRLREDAPDLITTNVNRLLQTKSSDRRMIRTLGGRARAWLSDRYRALDYEDVAERALPMIQEAGYNIVSANVTESKLYIHVVSPRTEGELRVGDPVRFGWVISDSEVGMGTLSIQLFMERLRCLNGMVVPEFSNKRAHLGGRVVGDSDYLVQVSTETTKAADDALWFGVRDHIREFSSPLGIRRVMERLKEQTEARVEGDPQAVVEVLANKFLLKEEEKKSVLYSFLEHGDRTRFGLANAITQLANDHTDYDRGVELEQIGGNVLMSGGGEWKSISTAKA